MRLSQTLTEIQKIRFRTPKKVGSNILAESSILAAATSFLRMSSPWASKTWKNILQCRELLYLSNTTNLVRLVPLFDLLKEGDLLAALGRLRPLVLHDLPLPVRPLDKEEHDAVLDQRGEDDKVAPRGPHVDGLHVGGQGPVLPRAIEERYHGQECCDAEPHPSGHEVGGDVDGEDGAQGDHHRGEEGVHEVDGVHPLELEDSRHARRRLAVVGAEVGVVVAHLQVQGPVGHVQLLHVRHLQEGEIVGPAQEGHVHVTPSCDGLKKSLILFPI